MSAKHQLAGIRGIVADLADALRIERVRDPVSRREWVTVIEVRAARGWGAEAEPLLTGLAGDAVAGSPLQLAVADMRSAIRRLAEFLPDLVDTTDGLDDDWHQVETAASRNRFDLIRADTRGRLRRLGALVGEPPTFIRISLSDTQARIVKALASGGPQTAEELAASLNKGKTSQKGMVYSNTMSSAVTTRVTGLRALGLVAPIDLKDKRYHLTPLGRQWAKPDESL